MVVVGSDTALAETAAETGANAPSTSTTSAPEVAAQKLELCERVPEIRSSLEGTLSSYQNPDPEVRAAVHAYGLEHPDTYVGHWLDRNRGGVIMVAFTDDPEPHRAALLARRPSPEDDPGGPPITDDRPLGERDDMPIDVVQVAFDDASRSAAQNKAHNAVAAMGIGFDGSGFDMARQRVVLYMVNPSPEELEELAERLDLSEVCVDLTVAPEAPPAGPLQALPGHDLADPLVVCPNGDVIASSQLAHLPGIDDIDHPAVDALRAELAAPSGEPFPEGRWVVIRIGHWRATFAVLASGGAGSATVAFERREGSRDDGWVRGGGAWESPCYSYVPMPPGLGRVDVYLDGEALPDPDSTSVLLLTSQQGCAGGREMGDTLRGPEVRETDDAVLVAFAVALSPGSATCPGNPLEPVTIELSEPLGERALYDGLYWPPQPLSEAEQLDW